METRDLQRRDHLRRWLSYPGVTQEKVARLAGYRNRENIAQQAAGQVRVQDRTLQAAQIVARRAIAELLAREGVRIGAAEGGPANAGAAAELWQIAERVRAVAGTVENRSDLVTVAGALDVIALEMTEQQGGA